MIEQFTLKTMELFLVLTLQKIFLEAYLQQQEFTLTFVGVACFAACLSSIAQVTFIFHSFS